MAIFHCSIKVVSRGKGKSAVGAAAYRSGEKITNEYDGITHDYTRKGGVDFTGILLPDNTPTEYQNRSTLWNAVERVERSKNAQLARDIEMAIPNEIPQEQWQRLMIDYCKENFVSKGMIADFCIHDKQDGNPHCHILLTMRPLDNNGQWGAKSKKEYVLNDEGNRIRLPSGNWKSVKVDTTDWNSQDNAEKWRASWSDICNRYLEQNQAKERIDHRSYKRQGIDKIPSIHLGVQASQMEQKGIDTDRGNINSAIAEDNKKLRATRARITRLMKWQREEKSKPLDLAQTGDKISIKAQLQAYTPSPQTSQYRKVKDLKNLTGAMSFLEDNSIETIEDFYSKINDMNKSFYVLKGEISKAEKAITALDRQLNLWEKYQKCKPLLEKYNALTETKKQTFAERYGGKVNRALEVKKIWSEFKSDGGAITPKQWQKDKAELQNNIKLYQWKMEQYKTELSRAEHIKKVLDEAEKDMKQTQCKAMQKEI